MEKKRVKIVLCGYYGRGNFGDEVILSQIQKKIRATFDGYRVELRVLRTKSPAGVLSAIVGADIFIFGGGSLLQNATSDASFFYYIALIGLARLTVRHLVMLANGIGPIRGGFLPRTAYLRALGWAAAQFDDLSVRDSESQMLLNSVLRKKQARIIPDPAFCCFKNGGKINHRLIKDKYIVFIPCRGQVKRTFGGAKGLARWLEKLKNDVACEVIVAVLNPEEDLSLARRIALQLGGRVAVIKSVSQARAVLGCAKLVVSQRYHGALFAAGCGAPTLAVSDDPKMCALCRQLGLKIVKKADKSGADSATEASPSALYTLTRSADSELSAIFAKLEKQFSKH